MLLSRHVVMMSVSGGCLGSSCAVCRDGGQHLHVAVELLQVRQRHARGGSRLRGAPYRAGAVSAPLRLRLPPLLRPGPLRCGSNEEAASGAKAWHCWRISSPTEVIETTGNRVM